MGASASRIWTEICGLQSDDIRAHMIETVMMSPDLVREARGAGVYSYVVAWLSAYRQGSRSPFPYATGARDTIQHDTPRWSMYTTPIQPQRQETAVVISPAAKALDYFQESLALLGIDDSDTLTYERLKAGYKRASLKAHPDKPGGSKERFDEVRKAFQYVEKILNRINPKFSPADEARMKGPVTQEAAVAYRTAGAPALNDEPPVSLSAKKLDMSTFNRLFEENRLPDPARDNGYGDWLKSGGGSDEIAVDARLKGKVTPQMFESVFREKAMNQTNGSAIIKQQVPDSLVPTSGYELGGAAGNFTAPMGSDMQFTDLKEAYTTGSTRFQEVAHVKVTERSARSVAEAERIRAEEMARVDPDEGARIAAAAAALEERERQRRLRLAQQDTTAESWHEQMRRRLLVNTG